MSSYSVSAVLCHHKGELINKAVDTLLESKDVDLQIIVVTSNDSYDDSRVTVVRQEGGPAIKRNVGFKFCEHPLIAFFDDDIAVRPWTVYEMAKALTDNKDCGMVYGKLLNMEFTDHFDEAGSFLTWSGFLWSRAESGTVDRGQYESIEPVLAGKSASCMIHRRVFAEVGQFDPSYEILAEETDLSWRVWLYGYRVLFVPSSVTYHAFGTKYKPKDFYIPRRVYYNGCRNYLSMLLTNLNTKHAVLIVPFHFFVWFCAGIGMLISRKFEAGLYILKGLYFVLNKFPSIMVKRKFVQNKRKISDIDLFKIVMKSPKISYYTNRFFHYIKTGMHG